MSRTPEHTDVGWPVVMRNDSPTQLSPPMVSASRSPFHSLIPPLVMSLPSKRSHVCPSSWLTTSRISPVLRQFPPAAKKPSIAEEEKALHVEAMLTNVSISSKKSLSHLPRNSRVF